MKFSLICEHSDAVAGVHWCPECSAKALREAVMWGITLALCVLIAVGQKQ